MRLDPVNAVSSFHYYMWNAWGEEECKITFGGAYKHFWEKWNSLASKSILGAAELPCKQINTRSGRTILCRTLGQ